MSGSDTFPIRLGDLLIYRSLVKVRRGQRDIRLTRKEMAVLWTLVSETGKAFRRDELLRQAWGQDVFVSLRTVDVYISRLRKKLVFRPARVPLIETVWGVGYRLRHPGQTEP
jgi:DNA-binding response OmpR family regulator